MPTNTEARGFIGAGDSWINPIDPDTGEYTGWFKAETTKFELKPNSEIKEQESKGRDTYGQVTATVAINKPADFSMTLTEASKDNLTLAFMGKQAALNQASVTLTDEPVTVGKLGKGVQLPAQNLAAAGFAVKNTAGSTTYVLGTDYEVNYRLGLLVPLVGGAITEDQALKVSGTANAYTGVKIRGAVQPSLRCHVKFDGKNMADGRPVISEVYEAVLTPQSGFDFLADDWNEVQLQGRMTTPTGKSEPFTVEFRTAD